MLFVYVAAVNGVVEMKEHSSMSLDGQTVSVV